MSIVQTKGTNYEDATEFAYVACTYAYVNSVNQAYDSLSSPAATT